MEPTRPVLVLGAGIAGMTVADELAKNRVPVLLLERETRIGGHAARWACMATERCQKCSACLVSDVKARVLESPLVEVRTCGRLEEFSGAGETIRVRVLPVNGRGPSTDGAGNKSDGRPIQLEETWEADAVFVATGFETFPAEEKPMLRYKELDRVITTEDLDRAMRQDRLGSLPGGQEEAARIAFLQCVGSRDREAGRDYCSQVCCKTSLRLAGRLLHEKPDWGVTLFYIDLQVFGKGFRTFYRSLRDRIRLVQGVPGEVLLADDGRVALVFEEVKSGRLVTESFDLVVLAVGMVPAADAAELSSRLGIPLERHGFFERARGRQGLRIYTVGACEGPVDIPGARRQAQEAVGHYLASRMGTVRERSSGKDGSACDEG